MSIKYVYRSTALALVMSAMGVSAVSAQTQSPAPTPSETEMLRTGGLDEIIVTAERRSGNLQSVPIAVSALSPEALENVQVQTTQELQKIVPGLRMTSNITTPTNFTIALRGSIQQDASVIVTESPVGIYVDDIYIPRLNGANAQLADIERVEVLRGPQGTLYGRNALSGAMKFVSKTPGDEFWVNATAGYGSYDRYKLGASSGGKLAEDVYGSFAILANGTNGFYENVATGEDFGQERNIAMRGKLRFTPGDWDIVASVSYARSKNEAQPMVAATAPATGQYTNKDIVPIFDSAYRIFVPDNTLGGLISEKPRGKTTQIIASLNASYDMDWATLRSITGFVQTKDYFSLDLSGMGVFPLGSELKSEAISQEIQLMGTSFDDRLDWMFGGYFFQEKADQTMLLVTTMLSDLKTDSFAAFGQATYKITDQFSVTGGLRWTQDKKSYQHEIQPFLISEYGSFDTKNKYTAWTPKVSVNYELPRSDYGVFNSGLVYASMARGFKSGGYNGIPVADFTVMETVYGPETNWTYEAGIKADLLNRNLRVNAAYFINRISDLAANATVEAPDGSLSWPVSNVADATVKGLELEVTAVPTDGLNLFVNATFQSGKYRNIVPGSAPADAIRDFGKANIPQVPKYTWTVGFDYGHDFTMGETNARFKIGGDWYRTGRYAVLVGNNYYIEPYSRLNGFVGVELNDRYEFRVSGSNLADKTQFVSGDRALGGFILLPPREIMATLSFKM